MLPVSDVHDRQHGRLRGSNVIEVSADASAIRVGILMAQALDRDSMSPSNPYGDGQAAPRIVSVLCTVPLDRRLREKR